MSDDAKAEAMDPADHVAWTQTCAARDVAGARAEAAAAQAEAAQERVQRLAARMESKYGPFAGVAPDGKLVRGG